jgi:hypothetical protein
MLKIIKKTLKRLFYNNLYEIILYKDDGEIVKLYKRSKNYTDVADFAMLQSVKNYLCRFEINNLE